MATKSKKYRKNIEIPMEIDSFLENLEKVKAMNKAPENKLKNVLRKNIRATTIKQEHTIEQIENIRATTIKQEHTKDKIEGTIEHRQVQYLAWYF